MYFENIKGHEFAKKYMINSIKNGKINHAYMFEGIEGIGKETFANDLAQILLETPHLENAPDCIRIKAEGNSIKIAQIRDLQSDIVIKPHKKYKIYIIDKAEKMTVEAQNALLKTLEEPPEYAIIILVTNNKESLLPTIRSRCEVVKFTPIPLIEVKNYLISQGVESNRAGLLSSFSRGSMKKALELASSNEFYEMKENVQKYIETILSKNMVEILNIPSEMEQYKSETITVLDMMINYFRGGNKMLFHIYGDNSFYQLLGWILVFAGLVIFNEIARRSKAQAVISIIALVANVCILAAIIKRSVEQKKNPYKNEIFTDQKNYKDALLRAAEANREIA